MKFSIIIPVYQVEKYLHECVDSVLKQNYHDFEVILVDDGSRDKCPDICDDYARKDNRVKVIHQPNAGLSCARNSGTACAQGTYIIYLDSDDYLEGNDALQKIEDKTENSPDVILYGYKKFFESDGTFGSPVCFFPAMGRDDSVASYLNRLLLSGTYAGTAWCKVVKTSLMKENHIEFKPGLISEDHDWYVQIMMHVKSYATINEALYVYRLRPGSISHGGAKLKSLTDNLWIQETWYERINEATIPNELRTVLLRIWAYYMGDVMVLYSSYDYKIRKQYLTEVHNLMPLFDNAVTKRSLIIKTCCKVLGISVTSMLLHWAGILKKRT